MSHDIFRGLGYDELIFMKVWLDGISTRKKIRTLYITFKTVGRLYQGIAVSDIVCKDLYGLIIEHLCNALRSR